MPLIRHSSNAVIARCEATVELLEQQRQTLYSQAVTLTLQRDGQRWLVRLGLRKPMTEDTAKGESLVDIDQDYDFAFTRLRERMQRLEVIASACRASSDGVVYLDAEDLTTLGYL